MTEGYDKLSIIIPLVELRQTTLRDAVEFLRAESHRLDPSDDPDYARGVQALFAVNSDAWLARRITLTLENVTLLTAFLAVGKAAGLRLRGGGINSVFFCSPTIYDAVGSEVAPAPPPAPSTEENPSTGEATMPLEMQAQIAAKYPQVSREISEKMHRAGANVGRVADNLMEAAHAQGLFEKVPYLGKKLTGFNHWMFNEYQRGVVEQAHVIAYERNRARFPEMSDEEVGRQSAKEVNEAFGNLGRQGFFKSRTMQDAARLVGFAPQWAEGMFKSEARGIGQAARIPVDGFRGKGWRIGSAAQAMGTLVLASLVGNQLLNLLTAGKPTWQNEDGHKWDAFIPGWGGSRGFWFSPLSIAAEYSHAMIKYLERGENALDAAGHIASNKLSGPARGLKDLVTGKDYADRPFGSMGERLKAAAIDALPSPMPLSGSIEKDPKAPLGYGWNKQPGSLEKQALSMIGLKVDAEPSARSQMYQIAEAFRPDKGNGAARPASPYADLRRALDAQDMQGAQAEIMRLVTEGGRPIEQIGRAVGWQKGRPGKAAPELYTGSADAEEKMRAALTPEQRKMHERAKSEREAALKFFLRAFSGLDPEQKRALSLASVAARKGNRQMADTLGRASAPATAPARKKMLSIDELMAGTAK